jgi:hypothetical protein
MSGLFRRLAERASGQRQPMLRAWVLPVFLADDGLIEEAALAPPAAVADAAMTPVIPPPVSQRAPDIPFAHSEPQPAPLLFPEPEQQRESAVSVAPSTLITEPKIREISPPTWPELAAAVAPALTAAPTAPQLPGQRLMPAPLRADPAGPALFNPPPAPATVDEIHVHIGRIEVTTMREPAPARHPARTPQPSLSLDDYLARRRGQPSRGEPS